MPKFGDFETFGEPLAITEDRGHVSTVWRARKAEDLGDPTFAVKYYVPQRRPAPEARAEDPLDNDPAQKFLAGIKQLQKARSEGSRGLAPIHDFGFSDEGVWYATDFYPRKTLKAWIARRGGVDSAALGQVVHGIVTGCLGLKRARGFSHGNLKAANVFLVGKPQPLRRTPLHLADAYPAAPLHLARLIRDDRRAVNDLPPPAIEVQDLRALGELLLQLVEGRLVASAFDYNYPIEPSPAWEHLGRDGKRWRELCNRLLDPQLSLEKVNLEKLAQDYRPSGINGKLPIILSAAAIICLVGGGVIWKARNQSAKPAVPKSSELASPATNEPLVIAPGITSPPSEQSVTEGGTAKFSVVASGTTPMSYQWKRDGVNVSGGTNAALTLNNVVPNQAGSYTVEVQNSAGSKTSAARLTVVLQTQMPKIRPEVLAHPDAVQVEISATPGATIYYTLDGGDPTASAKLYSGPFNLTDTKTVKAMAMASGQANSAIASATFTVTATPVEAKAPPKVDVEAGTSKIITLKGSGPPGAKLSYKVTSTPKLGSLGEINGETVTYTANGDAIGQDSFSFTVSDGVKSSAREVVNISIIESAQRKEQRTKLDGRLKELEDYYKKVSGQNEIPFDAADVIAKETLSLESDYTKYGWLKVDGRKKRIDEIKKDVRLQDAFKDSKNKGVN